MPSFLEREQIQPIQPYIADIGSILNTYQTKQAYWAQGAQQVKNAYQSYLGLNLTREDNQSNLKQFMESANGEMKKVAQTDLSVGDNQAAALGIFDPLTNGKTEFSQNIMGDHSITEHYQKQMAVAESYRNKDGGKEFSALNQTYLNQKLNDFRTDSNPNSWREHAANRAYYTPYYDYSKEMKDAMEKYKPSTVTTYEMTKDGKYITSQKNASWQAEDIKRYLNGVLSDKAKNQINIEGSVRYYGNDSVLSGIYSDTAIAENNIYNKQLAELNELRKCTIDKEEIEKQDKQIATLSNKIIDNNSTLKQLSNPDFLKRNRDYLAGTLQFNKL